MEGNESSEAGDNNDDNFASYAYSFLHIQGLFSRECPKTVILLLRVSAFCILQLFYFFRPMR